MLIETQNSLYEVEEKNNLQKRIRRLSGKADPTPRQGKDGEWKGFSSLERLPDNSFYIIWHWDRGDEGESIARGTHTSRAIKIDGIPVSTTV